MYLICILFLSLLSLVSSQDLGIYGLFAYTDQEFDDRQKDQILTTCFGGFGLVTCTPYTDLEPNQFDQLLLSYQQALNNPYEAQYCVECCGQSPVYEDTWSIYCQVDVAARILINLLGRSLYLARRSTPDDREYISCPLKRSACTYDSNDQLISCEPSTNTRHLVGYTAYIKAKKYYEGSKNWNGVESCEIVTEESIYPLSIGDRFRETIVMSYKPAGVFEFKLYYFFIFFAFFLIVVYVLSWWFRSDACQYCQKRLVYSVNLCIICRILGAELPDNVLIKVLESKGDILQGNVAHKRNKCDIFYSYFYYVFTLTPLRRILMPLFRLLYSIVCCRKISIFENKKVLPTYLMTKTGKAYVIEDANEEDKKLGNLTHSVSSSTFQSSAANGATAEPVLPVEMNDLRKKKKKIKRNIEINDFGDLEHTPDGKDSALKAKFRSFQTITDVPVHPQVLFQLVHHPDFALNDPVTEVQETEAEKIQATTALLFSDVEAEVADLNPNLITPQKSVEPAVTSPDIMSEIKEMSMNNTDTFSLSIT